MEDAIRTVSELVRHVNSILRYVGAGAVFTFVLNVLTKQHFQFLSTTSKDGELAFSVFLTILFVTSSGVVLYLIHRAVIYPVVSWCHFSYLISHNQFAGKSDSPKSPRELDRLFVRMRIERQKNKDELIQGHLDTWAAQVHFLYASALALLLALITAIAIGTKVEGGRCALIIVASVLLGLCAFNHDRRLNYEHIENLPKC